MLTHVGIIITSVVILLLATLCVILVNRRRRTQSFTLAKQQQRTQKERHVITPTTSFEPGSFYEADTDMCIQLLLERKSFLMLFHATWCQSCPQRRQFLMAIASDLPVPVVSCDESVLDVDALTVLHILDIRTYPCTRLYRPCGSRNDFDYWECGNADTSEALLKKIRSTSPLLV